jgi:hypothetical protein
MQGSLLTGHPLQLENIPVFTNPLSTHHPTRAAPCARPACSLDGAPLSRMNI